MSRLLPKGPMAIIMLAALMHSTLLWAFDDPTRPPRAGKEQQIESAEKVAVAATKKIWSLESVLIAQKRQIAVINGEIVKRGDRVNGARVVSIKKSGVTLYKKGKYFKLLLVSKSKTRLKNRTASSSGR
ncbi:MAG: general secretion pathway protein GspB [Candidatus Polarisedimenticolaceae bacterium]|nr:general secretion pathway protein GspB [Candidatus Polarisedimenticolaceae bacterium]